MRDAVIIDAVRTPIGKYAGALKDVRPDDLLAHVIARLVERTRVPVEAIEDVYAGCANQAGEDNRNVARMAALVAGLPIEIPGATVNRLCGSGLEAINDAARAIQTDSGDVFIAGGVESMTRAPFVMLKAAEAFPRGAITMADTTIGWRFTNPRLAALYPPESMGETAENVAEKYRIGREEQDAFALQSHQRSVAAIQAGRFKDEIVPVPVPQKKGEPVVVDTDEGPRPVLLTSREKAKALGLQPMARILATAVAGVHPSTMGIGPVPATQKALKRAGLTMDQIELIELNEAFAAQSLACIRDLGIDQARCNVNGGAIALGHPLGCSGARILTTLLHEMRRRQVRYGLATMCIGVGQGIATIVGRL
ncbi:MAG: 3-oxoadipyl-CoA thiolase [candidate division NC10 bacterium]|nr:3-oxoadipyl-CoA thiolase [candidate division NC10 bacterium]